MIYIFIWHLISALCAFNEEDYFNEKLKDAGVISSSGDRTFPGISTSYMYYRWIKKGGGRIEFVTNNWLYIRFGIHANFYVSLFFLIYSVLANTGNPSFSS